MKKHILLVFLVGFVTQVSAQQKNECNIDQTILNLNTSVHKNACLDLFYSGGLLTNSLSCDTVIFGTGSSRRFLPTGNTVDHMNIEGRRNADIKRSLDQNTLVFLTVSNEEQKKVLRKWPELCVRYAQLADKIETSLKKNYPTPHFAIQSCNEDNSVAEVILRYPHGKGTYVVKQNGKTLNVVARPPSRKNYALHLVDDARKGIDVLPSFTETLRYEGSGIKSPNGGLSTTKSVAELKQSRERPDIMSLNSAMDALYGFNVINTRTGKNCEDNVSADALLNEILRKEAEQGVQ